MLLKTLITILGEYERTPLYIVLANDYELRNHPRNLKLAKMLVQKGANPNLRIPDTDFDGAFPSPCEELLEYYANVYMMHKGNIINSG